MVDNLTTEFADYIPTGLDEGVIYISTKFRTAVHLCACGCGNKVVTPIGPALWVIEWDGESVSLRPSVGNWGFPCRSHYVIRRGQIRWARQWTDSEIAAGAECDRADRRHHYDGGKMSASEASGVAKPDRAPWFRRVFRRD